MNPVKIIHLEDNMDDQTLIASYLKYSPITCKITAVDSKEKFEAALRDDVDIILCDYGLPNYNGLAALEHVKKMKPGTPFVLISGTIGEDKTIQMFEAGVTDFITKENLDRLIPSLRRILKDLEEKKKRRIAELNAKKSHEELEQFAYVASHDLKAPLRAIERLSTWIAEDEANQLSEESKKNIQLLRQRTKRMYNLLEGILEYSRASRVKIKIEEVSVKKILQDVIDSISPPTSFHITFSENLPILKTTPTLLFQVFSNLITNAIKHHDQKAGKVNINAEEKEDHYLFSVKDDGPGIAPQYHKKIFQIFQTLQAKDIMESTGIGLSIVKKIIESQGGKIFLNSDEGKGATFFFTWPKEVKATHFDESDTAK